MTFPSISEHRVPKNEDQANTAIVDAQTDSGSKRLRVEVEDFDPLLDVLERIQQQLAEINDGNNLEPGERWFD